MGLFVLALASADPAIPVCAAAKEKGMSSAENGWIFTKPDLMVAAVPAPAVAPGFGQLADALSHAPATVMVLLLPSRSLSAAGSVAISDYDAIAAEASHRGFAAFLREHGLPVIDALGISRAPSTSDPFYLLRDNHLSHAGAKSAADLIAKSVGTWPDRSTLPVVSFASTPSGKTAVPNEAASVLLHRFCGTELPEPQVTNRWRTARTDAQGLLDEEAPPSLALWGTSNASALSNLEGFLDEALHTPVDALATKGGGILGSLYSAVRDPKWRSSPPKLVIWEVSTVEYWRTVDGAPNPQDPTVYDEIVPAVWGDCASTLAQGDWVGPGQLLAFKASSSPTYLVIESESPELTELTIHFGNGLEHKFEDYNRSSSFGHYFYTLPELSGEVIVSAAWLGSPRLRAHVCAAPAQ